MARPKNTKTKKKTAPVKAPASPVAEKVVVVAEETKAVTAPVAAEPAPVVEAPAAKAKETKTASKKKVRLTFYDKYKKLIQDSHCTNKLPWGFNIEKQQGKYRLELVLKNRELVKEYLNLRDNTLREVLNSREQPISRFYWELIKCPVSIQPFVCKNWKDYQNYVTAKASKFDLAKIEERLRMHYHPWRTSLLTPYISICNGRRKMQKAMRNLTSKVKELLTIRYEEQRRVSDLVG